jgi:NADH-quinone oxidoreductase subunit L
MNQLLPWMFLATLPGCLLTGLVRGLRPGVLSLPGPLLLLGAMLWFLLGDAAPLVVRIDGWLPMLPDGAFALRLDALAATLLAVVGFVSTCVYVYSLSYLHDDPSQRRFFCLLDLFLAAMSLLVLAGNLVVLVAGWAGVGLVSFLLISFWRDREHTLGAGLQALTANAIGDGALLLACVLVPAGAGDLTTLAAQNGSAMLGGHTLLAALLVTAAAAKSAQGLFYFWLPSAMAGPTPVSALIHAATMVAAGVYLLVRTSPLLALAPAVMHGIAWLGVVTAICSGVASLWQTNYKRGLAYSTCSQLGYMFAAVGFGAPFAAFFHLVTHAAFKALLFLCAGAVIHAAHGEERLAHLTGMKKHLPRVALLNLIGSLALCGLPLVTAGAFSKDLILEAGLEHAPALGYALLFGTLLTGLYTGRLHFGVFGAAAHGGGQHDGHGDGEHMIHAPDALLQLPLVPLALAAIGAGWLGAPLAHLLGVEVAIHAISPLGLVAGALGLGGFLLAGLWQRRAHGTARLPDLGLDWVPTAANLSAIGTGQIARLHDGRLFAYLFTAVVGIAALIVIGIANAP